MNNNTNIVVLGASTPAETLRNPAATTTATSCPEFIAADTQAATATETTRLTCRRCGLAAVGALELFTEARWLITGEWALCINCIERLGVIAHVRFWLVRLSSGKFFITAFIVWNIVESLFNLYQMTRLFLLR